MAHGPKPRSHAHGLPKKVRRLGIKCALSAKAFERRLVVVDSLKPPEPKTVRIVLNICDDLYYRYPAQKVMFGKLNKLLEEFPRLSVLMVDSSKAGEDGGYVSCVCELRHTHVA